MILSYHLSWNQVDMNYNNLVGYCLVYVFFVMLVKGTDPMMLFCHAHHWPNQEEKLHKWSNRQSSVFHPICYHFLFSALFAMAAMVGNEPKSLQADMVSLSMLVLTKIPDSNTVPCINLSIIGNVLSCRCEKSLSNWGAFPDDIMLVSYWWTKRDSWEDILVWLRCPSEILLVVIFQHEFVCHHNKCQHLQQHHCNYLKREK